MEVFPEVTFLLGFGKNEKGEKSLPGRCPSTLKTWGNERMSCFKEGENCYKKLENHTSSEE